jgi:hypothetical protein
MITIRNNQNCSGIYNLIIIFNNENLFIVLLNYFVYYLLIQTPNPIKLTYH